MLTALRAYASAAVLCAHCVARIRTANGATAMCSLRCAHTPPQPRYVLTALRAYARLFDVISIVYDYRFVTMPTALLYHGPLFRPNPVGVSGEYPQATPG